MAPLKGRQAPAVGAVASAGAPVFESIDRPTDGESRRRSAASFALTSLFYASVAGSLAAFLTSQVEPTVTPIEEVPLVLVELKPLDGGGPPPPPVDDEPREPTELSKLQPV